MKKHISPSQIDTFMCCGQQWYYRYIEGRKIPPAFSMIKGTSVHAAAEENGTQKMQTFKDLPTKDLVDIAVAKFEDCLKEPINLSEDEETKDLKALAGAATDSVVGMASVYSREVAHKYQPVGVEVEQVIELDDEYDLLGYIDLITDKGELIDFKTSSRAKSQADVDDSTQLTFYSLTQTVLGNKHSKLVFENIIDTKKPKSQRLETDRDETDHNILLLKLDAMKNAIQKGVFLPAAPGSWVCSKKFCGYYSICPFVRDRGMVSYPVSIGGAE